MSDLVTPNYDIVEKLSASYSKKFGIHVDDLQSEAGLALMEASRRYDFRRNKSFRHFARLVIRSRLYDAARKELRRREKYENFDLNRLTTEYSPLDLPAELENDFSAWLEDMSQKPPQRLVSFLKGNV